MTKLSLALLACLAITGCDYVAQRSMSAERADKMYRTAMAESAAGRLDKATEILQKVVAAHPDNASARFQLACLLHENRGDYLAAVCNYREYAMLDPHGDKKSVAERRAADCERLLANALAKKYNLGGSADSIAMGEKLSADNQALKAQLEKASKEMETLKNDLAALRRENDRIRRMMVADDDDDGAPSRPQSTAAQSAVPATIPDEASADADEAGGVDRVKLSADVDNLIAEENSERRDAPFGKTVKPAPEPPAKKAEPPHEPRPKRYLVREGDTLIKLAIRFYGAKSAWLVIRDANKATVSTDGRIRAGQELVLP